MLKLRQRFSDLPTVLQLGQGDLDLVMLEAPHNFLFVFVFPFFETVSSCRAKDGPGLTILPPKPPGLGLHVYSIVSSHSLYLAGFPTTLDSVASLEVTC